MSKKKALVLCFLLFLVLSRATFAQDKTASAEVSVSIGDYSFRLFGFTSPSSLVTVEGVGIFDQTYSKNNGYFEFKNRFSPFSTREPCLYAQDQLGRTSKTICIPAFPKNRNVDIGPVLLPPTVQLDKGEYFVGDQVILSGQTVPNTDVKLSFFIDQNRKSPFSLIPAAYAVTFPKFTAKADSKGNYSVSVPSSQADYYRIFAQDLYLKQDSPRSNTLSVNILPWWMILMQFFLLLWNLLRSRFLELLIFTQILALLYYCFRIYLKPHIIAKNRSLALRGDYSLLDTEHELASKKD